MSPDAHAMRMTHHATLLRPMDIAPTQEAATRRIAVIAIHGVADQQPGDSAADVVGLLLSASETNNDTGQGTALYSGFKECTVHIPLSPVRIDDKAAAQSSAQAVSDSPSVAQRAAHSLSERHGYIAQGRAQPAGAKPPGCVDAEAIADEAMRIRLAGYKGTGDRGTYTTTRLEGARTGGTGVDVYEM